MSARRASGLVLGLSCAGVVLAAAIAWVHSRLENVAGYVSFCNVNERANCDLVLSSSWAYFLGVPVAWWAIAAYLAFAVAAVYVLQSRSAARRRQVASFAFAAAVAAVLYSLLLAGVSIFELRAVCLLCSGLYLVNAGLLAATWSLRSAVRTRRQEGGAVARPVLFAAAALAVLVAGLVGWAVSAPSSGIDPDFAAWYRAQPVVELSLSARHVRGSGDGVRIVEFSDFECGFCARAARALHEVLARQAGKVQLQFHHFPLDPSCNPAVPNGGHMHACRAAEAAECAGRQGRFWQYHDLLFANQPRFERRELLEYARRLGLDVKQFASCLDSGAAAEAVRADAEAGGRLGVAATPTLFINGRMIRGALDAERLGQAVRIELDAHRSP